MSYISGFVAAVPHDNKQSYIDFARKSWSAFQRYGALRMVESWEDDVPDGKLTSFPMAVQRAEGEAPGDVLDERERPNGIRIQQIRVPIGVIGIIYESRPNVTSDAAVLCLKAGNSTILRGGSEAIHSNRAIASALQEGGELRSSILNQTPVARAVRSCGTRGGSGVVRLSCNETLPSWS